MSNIKIIGAAYGAYGEQSKTNNVTSKVAASISKPGDTIEANNKNFGDPCHGHTKHFGAVYEIDGRISAVACEEGQTVQFN